MSTELLEKVDEERGGGSTEGIARWWGEGSDLH